MKVATAVLCCVTLTVASANVGAASTVAHAEWSGDRAQTIAPGRVELGILSSSHYGATDRLEISLHPLWVFVFPHLEAKAWAGSSGPLALAVRARLSYPTAFLGLISRRGAGGLLPETSKPPQALQIEGETTITAAWGERQWASLSLGLAVAPREHADAARLPLLDFPFLYPRFAPLYSVLVPRARLTFEGRIGGGLYYELPTSLYVMPRLPDVGTTYAAESALQLEYRWGDRVALSFGVRTSVARYAIGTRFHYLPYTDVRMAF